MYFSRGEQVALLVLLALLLTGGGLLLYTKGQQSAGPQDEPFFQEAPRAARLSTSFTVDVSGEVARPGVYQLKGGARAKDAVARAGGATKDADLGQVNLAALLHDGDRIDV